MSTIQTYTPILSTVVQETTNKSEMVASLIQFLILNPGRTSSYVEGDLVSFRKMAGEQGHSRAGIIATMEQQIPKAISRILPEYVVEAVFTAKDYHDEDEQALNTEVDTTDRFAVSFDLMLIHRDTSKAEPVILKGLITVGDDYNLSVAFNAVE